MGRRAKSAALCLLLWLAAVPARAADYPLLLFGGPEHEDFLGCLNCDASEAFSIWNGDSDYGSPDHPISIWNREGRYGSAGSPHSPWSRRPASLPVVVDRAGNSCGIFAVDRNTPGRVTDGYLIWLLEGHDWIADHLDEVREEFRDRGVHVPVLCGMQPDHGAGGGGG